jgi:uncharacterized protein (DUF2126 family)
VRDGDFEAGEWNARAVAPPAAFADRLIRKLRAHSRPDRCASRAGQWYPGESLPRWGYSIYWRRDACRCGAMPG